MARQKFEPSSRTVRRWCLGDAAAQGVQAITAAIWVVDPGQRTFMVVTAGAAAVLGFVLYRVIPDSTERTVKVPRDRKRELTGQDWREFLAAVTPVFFGLLIKDALPGRPGFWVENGVGLSAALGAAAAVGLLALRRRRRNPGSPRPLSG